MIIRRLSLQNVGLYQGVNEINLESNPEEGKPIVLIGGLNGAGKSTLFSSIQLCLYGRIALPAMSKMQYENHLKALIHRSNDLIVQPNHAKIALEFDYGRNGSIDSFLVERMWERKGDGIIEHLHVRKNDEALADSEIQNWQDFIRELIPLGLSQLFFFDGEKIQKMMATDNNELAKSIRALLGIDIVERLEADLKLFRTRYLKGINSGGLTQQLEQLDSELELKKAEIQEIRVQLTENADRLTHQRKLISEYSQKISVQGDTYYKNREKLIARKSELMSALEDKQNKLMEYAGGLMPIVLAGGLAKRLQKEIKTSLQTKLEIRKNGILDHVKDELKRSENAIFGELTIDQNARSKLISRIMNLLDSQRGSVNASPVLPDLSDRQAAEMNAMLEAALVQVPNQVKNDAAAYEDIYRNLQLVEAEVSLVPTDSLVAPMYTKLNELSVSLGALVKEEEILLAELNESMLRENEILRKREKILERMTSDHKTDEKIRSCLASERVLAKYKQELAKSKVLKLSDTFLMHFNRLHRKDALISQVTIDPDSFEIQLYDKHNRAISKESLSSGELEIFAMAMLWALARVSGQHLPLVIDTPLARLDTNHRTKIVREFFPRAAHQTIILSTDTEIDERYYGALKPFVNRSYRFAFDENKQSTTILEGYFWN